MQRQIQAVECKNLLLGKQSKGCVLCKQGRKTVLFITGLCSKHCFYCPISSEKYQHDVIYANERPISANNPSEILDEIKVSGSSGVGITGGDPLMKIERCAEIIRMVKKEFGKEFHIHLYTPLELVTQKVLQKLEEAGLDEIRFHPDLNRKDLWKRLSYSTKMVKGVEIPVIPGTKEELLELVEFIKDKVSFLNLNELETSETNIDEIMKRGFQPREEDTYAIQGSAELAREILEYAKEKTFIDVHFCTVRLKDNFQFVNRVRNRSKGVAQKYDIRTKQGSLIRGVIYLKELVPSFGHEKKLKELKNKEEILKRLKKAIADLQNKHNIPQEYLAIDAQKLRILTSIHFVNKYKKQIKEEGLVPGVTEELATYDQFELESALL